MSNPEESNNESTSPENHKSKSIGKTITVGQASQIVGCSPQQIRTLIRKGRILAIKEKDHTNPAGHTYQVSKTSVLKYAKTVPRKGWPRGLPRLPQ